MVPRCLGFLWFRQKLTDTQTKTEIPYTFPYPPPSPHPTHANNTRCGPTTTPTLGTHCHPPPPSVCNREHPLCLSRTSGFLKYCNNGFFRHLEVQCTYSAIIHLVLHRKVFPTENMAVSNLVFSIDVNLCFDWPWYLFLSAGEYRTYSIVSAGSTVSGEILPRFCKTIEDWVESDSVCNHTSDYKISLFALYDC